MDEQKPPKKEVLEELKKISPLLGRFKEQDQMVRRTKDVPPQYFESLPTVLWDRIQAEQPLVKPTVTAPKSHWLDALIKLFQNLFMPQLAIGFSIALLLIVTWFVVLQPKQESPLLVDQQSIPGIQEIPGEDLYNYVMMHIEDYDTEDLLEVASPISIEFTWPEIEDEAQVDEVIEELLEALDDADFL